MMEKAAMIIEAIIFEDLESGRNDQMELGRAPKGEELNEKTRR